MKYQITIRNNRKIKDDNYVLTSISLKEIIEKYRDKVVEVIDRKKDIVIVMDTCRIIIRK